MEVMEQKLPYSSIAILVSFHEEPYLLINYEKKKSVLNLNNHQNGFLFASWCDGTHQSLEKYKLWNGINIQKLW